jgi:hypothetical protein
VPGTLVGTTLAAAPWWGQVVLRAAAILPIVAAFELFDGLQVVGAGVLRGMGRTRPAAWANLAGYYGLALPAALLLSGPAGWGLEGLWWGLALGLFAVAAAITFYPARCRERDFAHSELLPSQFSILKADYDCERADPENCTFSASCLLLRLLARPHNSWHGDSGKRGLSFGAA